ncbi:hypothetical protein HHK36_004768 [Tetracentron sinense]|uniref:Uncharacterized protein n=1 Tax=Tetracentron sinense TaxID=13715 RepID=A0A834ZJQ0_TETSI|nr:hypothetical protein HHK36_004768 [Tetracentron sinense]
MAKTVSSLHTGLCSCAAPDPDYMVTLSKGGFLVFSPSDPSSINKLNSSVSRNYPPLISDMVSKPLNVPKEMIVACQCKSSTDIVTLEWILNSGGNLLTITDPRRGRVASEAEACTTVVEARLSAEMEALRSQVRRMNQALESFGRHLGNTFLSSDSDDTQPPDDTQG